MDAPATDYVTMPGYRRSAGLNGMAQRNREALIATLNAIIAGGREGLKALYHPDIVFHEADCLPYGGAHRGIDATRAAVGKLFETFDRLHTDVEDVLVSGDLAILYVHVDFRVRRNGRTGSFPACELYRFVDGKIVEWRVFYFDSNMVASAIAAPRAR